MQQIQNKKLFNFEINLFKRKVFSNFIENATQPKTIQFLKQWKKSEKKKKIICFV